MIEVTEKYRVVFSLKKNAAKQSMGWCETNIAGFMTAFPVCVFYIILSLSSQIAMTWQNLRHFDCLQVASWDPFDLIESPGHEIISLSTVTSHNTSQVVTLVTHPATGKIKDGNTAQFQEGRYSNIIKIIVWRLLWRLRIVFCCWNCLDQSKKIFKCSDPWF